MEHSSFAVLRGASLDSCLKCSSYIVALSSLGLGVSVVSVSGKKKDEDGQEGEEEEYPLNNLATSPMPTWLKCCNFRLFAGVGTGRIVAGN